MALNTASLPRTFVQLADSLVADFDIIELLTMLSHSCLELFDAGAVGILLGDQRGALQVVATSSEQARLLELFEIQNDEGPCLDCYSTGLRTVSGDLAVTTQWPKFSVESLAAGFRAVVACPLQLRNVVIGTLNMFLTEPVELPDDDLRLCQALADVATIAILQNKATKEAVAVNEQLQRALDSRIAIEQAKGIMAERLHVGMADAFSELRQYARDNNLPLSEVAHAVVRGTLTLSAVTRSNSASEWEKSGQPARPAPA
jgi:transcriptional regulator with GAF, ATPase, and Fis domain